MKRFYKLVSIEKMDKGFHILLDNRPVKTKSGAYLCAVNQEIATLIMNEWAEQVDNILPCSMPFTQILSTKIDRVSIERTAMSDYVLKYLDTDLLCYFTDSPEALAVLQKEKWQIWLDWFEDKFGYQLKTTTSLTALTQDAQAHNSIAKYIGSLNDDYFTILQLVTSVSGSLVLALALVNGAAKAGQVFDACFVEEHFKDGLYNAEKYGFDPILEKAQKSAMRDFQAAQDYVALL